ncbi:YfiR family protein [Hydrogenophaga pseudoflava]|uniref:YfiR family protein n=1 Tax=Hydrogenophaga pseudoflava TaxID=47421 RepID=UPI0027E3D328|nr:YfiR family protein [Hydrogenophaga pseudoflava]MDQ7744413.1 YfiR family protein [Hydrogenophaga pseudoflava]
MLTLWPRRDLSATGLPSADKVLANYLHKIIGYIEWPGIAFADPAASIVVGVMGSQDMFEALSRAVSGRPVHGRTIEVRQLVASEGASTNLHLLHVSAAAWAVRAHAKAASRERPPVLTTDALGGVDQGATIGFTLAEEGVRIEASLPAADVAGVKLSSRLLVVADRVVERPK